HGRRDIEAGALVQIRFWPFAAKNVLPVIGAERTSIFPLRINCAIAFTDGNPATFASRDSRALISFVEPGNNARRFWPMALPRFVVIRKRAVKGIQSWREFHRNVIATMSRIRIVHPAIIFGPFFVPRACAIGNRIVTGWFLADPEHGRYDVPFPWETLSRLRPISGQLPRRECD